MPVANRHQVAHRVGEGGAPSQPQTCGNGSGRIRAVSGWREENRGAGRPRAGHLLLDAADRLHCAAPPDSPPPRAPAIFCWMPPIGSIAPLGSISPVPAMNLPPVRLSGVILSMIPSANISPAL